MGADYYFFEVKNMDKTKLKDAFKTEQEKCRYEHGNAGYTGTVAETPDIERHKGIFTHNAAEAYIYKNAQKWENAIAVCVLEGNKMYYLVGALCSC